jgi:hypothetical protein
MLPCEEVQCNDAPVFGHVGLRESVQQHPVTVDGLHAKPPLFARSHILPENVAGSVIQAKERGPFRFEVAVFTDKQTRRGWNDAPDHSLCPELPGWSDVLSLEDLPEGHEPLKPGLSDSLKSLNKIAITLLIFNAVG